MRLKNNKVRKKKLKEEQNLFPVSTWSVSLFILLTAVRRLADGAQLNGKGIVFINQ